MKFDLIHPCANCPFRSDIAFYLHRARKQEIANGLLRDQTFTCHKTVDYSDDEPRDTSSSQHCAGALIILERLERPNQMMRIAERLGLYDRRRLDMNAPVYPDFDAWIRSEAHG